MQSQAIANILNDDSFKEALNDLIKLNTDIIVNSDVTEQEIREVCYMKVKVINEILGHLESLASDDKINKNNKRDK